MKKIVLAVCVFLLGFGVHLLECSSGDEEAQGRKVIESVLNRPQGRDFKALITMKLINSDGKVREQSVKVWRKDGETKGQEKLLAIFTYPPNLERTGFLVLNKKRPEEDVQTLYLSASRKTRRIGTSEYGGSFMGTEFAYYEMQQRELEEATHRLVKIEQHGKSKYYVVESIPVTEECPYSKIVQWVRTDYFPIRVDFYDKTGKHLKRLTALNLKTIDGILVAQELVMRNVQKDRVTRWLVSNIRFNTGLGDEIFTDRSFHVSPPD